MIIFDAEFQYEHRYKIRYVHAYTSLNENEIGTEIVSTDIHNLKLFVNNMQNKCSKKKTIFFIICFQSKSNTVFQTM